MSCFASFLDPIPNLGSAYICRISQGFENRNKLSNLV